MTEIAYRIRRSERARRVRVTVDAAGVEVVLPRRAPEREAAAAVRELEPWIRRRIQERRRAEEAVAARGEGVPYLGRLLHVRAQPVVEEVLPGDLHTLVGLLRPVRRRDHTP